MAEQRRRQLHPAAQEMREGRKRQQPAFAGGNGATQHPHEQCEMLHEGNGTGDPGLERAQHHLEQRQHDQPDQTKHHQQVLRLPEKATPSGQNHRGGRTTWSIHGISS